MCVCLPLVAIFMQDTCLTPLAECGAALVEEAGDELWTEGEIEAVGGWAGGRDELMAVYR